MSTDAVISSIMSSQINDSLTKVNHLMSQVEDSFSSVSTPTKFLPIIAELLAKMQNIVILSQKSNVSDSIPDEDDMRWDQSDVCQQSVLNLSNTSSLNDILEHEELFPTASSESDSSSIQSLSSTSSYNQVTFIDNVLNFMLKVAPENVFSRQKSKRRKVRKKRRLLHPELFSIWYYSSQLLSDVSKKTAPLPSYPEVDWSCVNKRFLTNVPNPVQYPVHGCSEDQDFYETMYVSCVIYGVISVPSGNVFHGYTWLENQGWVLHATMPTRSAKKTRRIEKMKRGRKKK